MPIAIDLSGRTALVTGAASGIGRAIALRLGAAGASVVATDIDVDRLAANAKQAEGLAPGWRFISLDVTDWDACCEVADDLAGVVDTVVTAAGVWTIASFLTLDPETWAQDTRVNLDGTLQIVRALLPPMVARGEGNVVTVSSDAGRVGGTRAAVYSAAKAGVVGFTKALAREVGRSGVRVNCVAPGPTLTPGAEEALAAWSPERITRQIPLGRLGKPEEIADAVLFLASDLSAWVTGQTLSVNGGWVT